MVLQGRRAWLGRWGTGKWEGGLNLSRWQAQVLDFYDHQGSTCLSPLLDTQTTLLVVLAVVERSMGYCVYRA